MLYRVLAGEYLGSEGELQAAVDEYLEAALLSEDPEIAQRATRIAFAAESWQQASMAADRWAVLASNSVPAHESAARAMLRVGNYFGAEYQLLRILDILEDSADAWVLVSRILAEAGDAREADRVLAQMQEQRPDADPANVYSARSRLKAWLVWPPMSKTRPSTAYSPQSDQARSRRLKSSRFSPPQSSNEASSARAWAPSSDQVPGGVPKWARR